MPRLSAWFHELPPRQRPAGEQGRPRSGRAWHAARRGV